MSEWLEWRRRNNRQTVLLLGSRAGALYRSIPFYNYCQLHTVHNLQNHPPAWSFHECYRVLSQKQLGERELHVLLLDAFKHTESLLSMHHGDGYFAEIVKRGYFREVVSTNIDDVVERALTHVGLSEGIDFEVLIPGKQLAEKRSIAQERVLPYRLTKVFGDCLSREYLIYNRQAYLTRHSELNQYLRSILSGDVLAIDIDPAWDSAILPLLKDTPATLWFVNGQEDIIHDQQIIPILDQTKSAIAVGPDYGYDKFWRALYQQLPIGGDPKVVAMQSRKSSSLGDVDRSQGSVNPPSAEASATSADAPLPQNKKIIQIMYIYCNDDLELMRHLWRHLQVLRNSGIIKEWYRELLQPGDLLLKQELELGRSQLIFVGFSPKFLSSEDYELAVKALNLYPGGTVPLVPILLRPVSNWKQTPFGAINPLPREGRVLSEMAARERERVLAGMAEDIDKLVRSLQTSEGNS
ncbi:MAG: hypothetical protein ACHQX1_03540 [Candidatus Micrarchaeales archaeon]